MKNVLLTFLLLINMKFLVAQGNVQQLPVLYDSRPEMEFRDFAAADKSGFYAEFFDKKTKSVSIDKYDVNGKKLFSAKLKDDAEYEILSENSLYVFSVDYDKGAKRAKLFLTDINSTTGVKAPATMATELDVIKHLDFNYSFSVSPDKTKLLVVSCFWAMSEEMEEKTIFQFYEVKGMKKIWEKQIDGKYTDTYIKTKHYTCDNEGNVLLYYNINNDIMRLKQSVYNGGGAPAIVYTKDKKLSPIDISLGSKMQIYETTNRFMNDGKLMIIGMMREPNNSEKDIKNNPPTKGGIFFMTYDLKTQKKIDSKENWFDEKTDKKLTGELYGAGDVLFSIDEFVEHNGDYYIAAHQKDVYRPIIYVSSGVQTYYSGDLLFAKMKPTGVVEWIRVAPRDIAVRGTTGASHSILSYNFFASGDKFNFVYLEHPANAAKYTLDDATKPKKFGSVGEVHNANVILTSFDSKGQGTKRIIMDNVENCMLPQTTAAVGNTLVLYMENQKKKEKRFGLMTP